MRAAAAMSITGACMQEHNEGGIIANWKGHELVAQLYAKMYGHGSLEPNGGCVPKANAGFGIVDSFVQ